MTICENLLACANMAVGGNAAARHTTGQQRGVRYDRYQRLEKIDSEKLIE